jgi:hypothetical protein
MAPTWLLRLNEYLAWLNPTLCVIAVVLAVLVAGAADRRMPGEAALTGKVPRPVECTQMTLPPELLDLRLYD